MGRVLSPLRSLDPPETLPLHCRQVPQSRVDEVRQVGLATSPGMSLFVAQGAAGDPIQDVDHERVGACWTSFRNAIWPQKTQWMSSPQRLVSTRSNAFGRSPRREPTNAFGE